MKILLILWAIGLAECDKLDRTYLPPSGSVAAGGYSEILNLPLERSSILKPGNGVLNSDGSLKPKFPNIALGIDRKGRPVIGSARFFANGAEIPTMTTSYELTQSSTLSPIQTFDSSGEPVTTVSKEYSSISPIDSIDPKLSYDQYLIQQILKPTKFSKLNPIFVSGDPVSKFVKENIGQTSVGFQPTNSDLQDKNNQQVSNPSTQNSFLDSNNNEYVSRQLNKNESLFRDPNSISTNLNPYNSLNNKYPTIRYESDRGHTSDESIPNAKASYPDKFYNQQTSETYSAQTAPEMIDDINLNPHLKTAFTSTLEPNQNFIGSSSIKTEVPSFTFSSTPKFSNENLGTIYSTTPRTQRIQAEDDKNADILNYENILTPNNFAFSFDTSNGIHVDESGTANDGVKAKGSYSYTGDDGRLYSIEYTADENGFIPFGDHLPTAPPIPTAVLRGIEEAEKNKKLGIIDDGSYDEAKYGHGRYQGLMYRPQNYTQDIDVNQPVAKNGKQQSETDSYKSVDLPGNNAEVLDFTKLGKTFTPSNNSQIIDFYKKGSYIVKDDNMPNSSTLLRFDDESINNKSINEPRNKFREDIPNENFDQNSEQNLGIISHIDNTQKEYNDKDINQRFHSGYDYTQPQTVFNDNDKNTFQSQFTSDRRNGDLDPYDDTRYEKIPSKSIINPNVSFNLKNQNPFTNSQLLEKTFDNPLTTPGNTNSINMLNGYIKPNIPISYNGESDQIRDKENIVAERVLSTFDPTYGATTLKPYRYQSSDTTNENVKYPSSSRRLDYSASTTPVPSEILSPSLTSTILSRSQTTPTVSLISSTSRPLITSERPSSLVSSRITSRPSGNKKKISGLEQDGDYRISTTKPNTSYQRVIERTGYKGRNNKVPVTRTGFPDDLKSDYGISGDPRPQTLVPSSRPENFGNQSNEKGIVEDFSGPKQPQRFDPEHGYYY